MAYYVQFNWYHNINIQPLLRMKICQYNIYFGQHPGVSIVDRMKDVCQCILEQDADIVCLQEVLFSMYENIIDMLSPTYPYVYPDSITTTYDTMILSRYPIASATTYKFEFTTMGRNIRLVNITDHYNNSYYLCTIHFESEFKDGCKKKIYQYNKCADILCQLYQNTGIPVIMCADTNICTVSQHSFDEAFNYQSKGWRDAWIENDHDINQELTFDANTNPILLERYSKMNNASKSRYSSRLDRIIHLSDMHTTDFKLFGTEQDKILSDHYGVCCTMSNTKPVNRESYVSNIVPKPKIITKKLF